MANLLEKMKNGIKKTQTNFMKTMNSVRFYGDLDEDFFEELEESLILSDLGMDTAERITKELEERVKRSKDRSQEKIFELLEQVMIDMVALQKKPLEMPTIILIVGVNGVGKTTTIAKLAQKYKLEGKQVMLAAADTFRAAATEQLEEWANRIGVDIIKSKQGADPSSVVYDAINAAKARNTDILIIDTAGRLHNKVNLMNELEKITRVIEREGNTFNVHNCLILDASTGQNALIQAKTFNDAVHLDGIILTKLDGTAKGGIAISIIGTLRIPIEYVGVGEKSDDLIEFDAKAFVKMLYQKDEE